MPPDPKVVTGVAAVVARPTPYTNAMIAPQFLVIRRCGPPPAEGCGTYSIPGGWMDDGESVFEAAARETEEETGLPCTSLADQKPLGVVTHRSETTGLWCVTVYVGLFALADTPTMPEPTKVNEARWVTRRDFFRDFYPDLLFHPIKLACDQGVI